MKAETCAAGREELYAFCERHRIPHQRCGKLVVATRRRELPALEELERRGHANGLTGLRRLRGEELAELKGVSVPIKLSGTFAEPSYKLDGEALAKAMLKGKVDEQKAKLTEKLGEKLGLPRGTKAPAEGTTTEGTTQEKSGESTEDAVKGLMKGIFGR